MKRQTIKTLPGKSIPGVLLALLFFTGGLTGQTTPWVSAYYAGWSQGWTNNGVLPAGSIDFSALTDVIHFSLVPGSDGSLDYSSNSITPTNSTALVQAAHVAGKKAVIGVGG